MVNHYLETDTGASYFERRQVQISTTYSYDELARLHSVTRVESATTAQPSPIVMRLKNADAMNTAAPIPCPSLIIMNLCNMTNKGG